MIKRIFLFSIALVLTFAAIPLFAESHEAEHHSFTVSTPAGERTLGGNSDHRSHDGLHKAEEKAPVIEHDHEHS